ncbi:sigma-70 family RNA polymerase sigma factor [Rapidithrix thailandica]|uniref:Sigma-70 family RNA polymerase sigma factor n=1 Tax=Rapidithrix thailandica TaxID=413964 RepID=A0AAW9S8E2_9BACT
MKDYQSLLFPYAYNILGSAEDAKDAIQDVILKYTIKGVQPENEKNYLIRGVINQSINLKRQKQRTQPEETWLPEPVATEKSDVGLELRELVSYSLLYLLERLNPKERAVFILKEAFAYTHEEIADVLSITIEHSRKLLSRANQKVHQKEKRVPRPNTLKEQFQSIEQFTSAIRQKDLDTLHQLLSKEITFYADGGDKIKVVKKYCTGIQEVADLLLLVYHKYQKNYTVKPFIMNHQPALLYYYRDQLTTCQVFELEEGTSRVKRISVVLDPEKLKNLKNL